jgi:mono/diheme cytochrome c family protein
LAALLLAPWPEAHLLLAPAVPTSLHQSPTGFTAQGIVRGQAVYQQHCLRCHGADGRGEGPDAAALPMWPPTLNGSLLWKRLDGELFWRVRHGMAARDGTVTMPGFEAALSDTQVWQVLDFLQANASGQMLRESGVWTYPVRMPDASLLCRPGRAQTVRSLRGQRLRVALAGPGIVAPADDPRLVTLQVGLPRNSTAPSDPECRVDSPELSTALSLLLGVPAARLGAYQLLVDRDGWLRARAQPGQAAWSEDDLVCRSTVTPTARAGKASTGDGLDGLIRRMDGEPVRLLRGGFPH